MKWALIDSNEIVQNLIEYDGTEKYSPPDDMSLVQVDDWVEIGMYSDADKPPVTIEDDASIKIRRNLALSKDLSLRASFRIEKRRNPDLTFSDYLDQLESEVVN